MQLQEIRRETFTISQPTEMQLLGTEAKAVLGYARLADDTRGVELLPVQRALAGLEIPILNVDDVKQYQVEKMLEMARTEFEAWFAKPEGQFQTRQWEQITIAGFYDEIPPFILRKAMQIKQACRQAQIMVEYLGDIETNPDPFLFVEVTEYQDRVAEKYYIEAWDEPGFEAKL